MGKILKPDRWGPNTGKRNLELLKTILPLRACSGGKSLRGRAHKFFCGKFLLPKTH